MTHMRAELQGMEILTQTGHTPDQHVLRAGIRDPESEIEGLGFELRLQALGWKPCLQGFCVLGFRV